MNGIFVVSWLVACFTSQQHASLSQGRVSSDKCMYCHTEIEVADQTCYLTQSQHTDTGLTSPKADSMMPGSVATGVPIFKSLELLDSINRKNIYTTHSMITKMIKFTV